MIKIQTAVLKWVNPEAHSCMWGSFYCWQLAFHWRIVYFTSSFLSGFKYTCWGTRGHLGLFKRTERPRSVSKRLFPLAGSVSAEVSLVPRGARESEAFVAVQVKAVCVWRNDAGESDIYPSRVSSLWRSSAWCEEGAQSGAFCLCRADLQCHPPPPRSLPDDI